MSECKIVHTMSSIDSLGRVVHGGSSLHASYVISRCETHGMEVLGADQLCAIGKIEAATEKALEQIATAHNEGKG